MDVPTVTGFRGIDIRVCVYPDQSHFPSQTFPDSFRRSGDCANSNRMVTTKCQDTSAFSRMTVDLFREFLSDGRYSKWVLHVSVRGIVGRHKFFVGMHGIVMMEFVAQFFGK